MRGIRPPLPRKAYTNCEPQKWGQVFLLTNKPQIMTSLKSRRSLSAFPTTWPKLSQQYHDRYLPHTRQRKPPQVLQVKSRNVSLLQTDAVSAIVFQSGSSSLYPPLRPFEAWLTIIAWHFYRHYPKPSIFYSVFFLYIFTRHSEMLCHSTAVSVHGWDVILFTVAFTPSVGWETLRLQRSFLSQPL